MKSSTYIHLKKHSYWIWRAIINPTNPILTQGTWKITRGNNIPITHPNWFSLRPGAHTLLHNQVTKVADLINQADATWKANTIRQLYDKNTADLILGIPLPKFQSSQDLLIWPHSISGHYQVKTAYALLHKDQSQALNAPRPGPIPPPKLWKNLWKLKLPNKLLTFTWKLMHHALPVKDVLNHTGIQCAATCMLCHTHTKILNHIFFLCPFARAVWLGAGINTSFLLDSNINMIDWLSKLLESSKDSQNNLETLSLLITIAWCLWLHSNQVIF